MSAVLSGPVAIDPRLEKYIATRDRRIAKTHWTPTPLLDLFNELLSRGETRVGGRASCGGAPDPSWTFYVAWREVVRKAQTLGYGIQVESIKQPNAWATKARGFWEENTYTLTTTPEPN